MSKYIKKPYEPTIIDCNQCGNKFTAMHWNSKICSPRCTTIMKNRSNLRRKHEIRGYEGYPIKKCTICFSEFKSTNSNQKTCSHNCMILRKRIKRNDVQKAIHKRDKKNPNYILKRMLRTCLSKAFYRKTNKSIKYCTYSGDEFRNHMEVLFKSGMSWENWGEWHIDHIRPLSSFNLIKKDGTPNFRTIRKANSLKNLQPLWAKENLSKHARWPL